MKNNVAVVTPTLDDFVFCNNIEGLLLAVGLLQYKPDERRLLIDSSKKFKICVASQQKQVCLCSSWSLSSFKGTLPKYKGGLRKSMSITG